MTDPLSSDEATSGQGAKENFIGRIERSEADADDEFLDDTYESDIDILYEVTPLTQYDNTMYELGVNVRSGINSKWMVFVGHLENIHGDLSELGLESVDDVLEFITGRVYEFEDVTFEEGDMFTFNESGKELDLGEVGGDENRANPMMLPIREVTDDDELAELGSQANTEDVEEVEL